MSDSKHGPPPEGLECLATMEDITIEDGNYVEYQTYPSLQWHPAKYEESVILQLLKDQFPTFVKKVKTTDCQAELRRLLTTGPPIYICDKHALPLPDNGDTYICKLWFSSDDTERAAKLEGALEGDERQKLWDDLKKFIIEDGREEGDNDDDVVAAAES